jgi:uncharacterized protein (TIGR03067 family)
MMPLAALLLVSAAPPRPASEKADVAALQGFWVLKTTEYLGLKGERDPTESEHAKLWAVRLADLPEERALAVKELKKQRTTLEFKGNTYEWRQWRYAFVRRRSGVESTKGTFKLDVRRKPKVMERRYAEPGGAKAISYGIYTVQGETLRLCVNFRAPEDPKKLPKSFVTDDEEEVALFTFRREKK